MYKNRFCFITKSFREIYEGKNRKIRSCSGVVTVAPKRPFYHMFRNVRNRLSCNANNSAKTPQKCNINNSA